MSDIAKKIVAGAASGFLAAAVVDINAWAKAGPGVQFSWNLAVKRWVAGAVSGAVAALGLGGVL